MPIRTSEAEGSKVAFLGHRVDESRLTPVSNGVEARLARRDQILGDESSHGAAEPSLWPSESASRICWYVRFVPTYAAAMALVSRDVYLIVLSHRAELMK